MGSKELRENFLKFFEKKDHKIVPSASLIPSDPTVLFTTAGMQQFKKYYLEEESPYGKNVASCQKCFRTSDIEEVGDESHLTFFEMLGNFSFGGYGKKEAIHLAKEFLESIGVKIDYVTVFEGDQEIPKDEESIQIWGKLGFSVERGNLKFGKREENFWGPTGKEGPCGPTTEIYCQNLEVWNIVFNQFYCHQDKTLTPLAKFGVDTGMGLERLAKISQNTPTIFETDLFLPIMEELKKMNRKEKNERAERIIADHLRGAVFLISESVFPSNIERGYVLRRLLRRSIRYGKLMDLPKNFLIPLAKKVIEVYQDIYPEIKSKEADIFTVIQKEEEEFEKTLERGLRYLKKEIEKCISAHQKEISGKVAFDLYQSFGFPLELTKEIAKEERILVNEEEFEKEFERHKKISRAGAEKKFGGIGKEAPYEAVKLHTATHLLHQALREVLGSHVKQMGSDITPERLRFDFSHPQKLTPDQIKKVEDLVNQKIKEDLEVKKEEMSLKEALDSGALAFFREKYPERVTVYTIGNFSKEICAGPHVKRTSELGRFKIIKEKSLGSGIRRIRAILLK